MSVLKNKFDKRKARVRRTLQARSAARPRLSVYRSSKHIYAQVIDDAAGKTVAAASTLEKDLKSGLKTGADKAAAAFLQSGHSDRWKSKLLNVCFRPIAVIHAI